MKRRNLSALPEPEMVSEGRFWQALDKSMIGIAPFRLFLRVLHIFGAIVKWHYLFQEEEELHEGICRALDKARMKYKREFYLTPKDRIDFMLRGGIGIEVKTGGSLSQLTRQLYRYAEARSVKVIIVIIALRRLSNLPSEINGKRIVRIPLWEY